MIFVNWLTKTTPNHCHHLFFGWHFSIDNSNCFSTNSNSFYWYCQHRFFLSLSLPGYSKRRNISMRYLLWCWWVKYSFNIICLLIFFSVSFLRFFMKLPFSHFNIYLLSLTVGVRYMAKTKCCVLFTACFIDAFWYFGCSDDCWCDDVDRSIVFYEGEGEKNIYIGELQIRYFSSNFIHHPWK